MKTTKMKTTNWKALARKLGALSVTALLLASCGSNKNEGKDSSISNPLNLGPVFNNPGAGNDGSLWSSLKSQVNCPQGRMSDLSFQLSQGSSYGNSISGPLQQGGTSGTSQGSYYGRSGNGDLLYVSKVYNGSQLAYNVVVSFCRYNDGYYEYIGDSANMSNFMVQNLTLNNGSNCATGAVTSGYVGFSTQAYPNTLIPIAFASAGINCY